MNRTNKDYRAIYEDLPEDRKREIFEIYHVMNKYCTDAGIKLAYDYRAEDFIGAITKYLLESKVE